MSTRVWLGTWLVTDTCTGHRLSIWTVAITVGWLGCTTSLVSDRALVLAPVTSLSCSQPPASSCCYQPPTSLSLSVYVSVTLRTGMRQPLTRVSGHSSSSVQLYSCTVVHTPSTTPQCVQPQSVRGRVSGRRHQAATDYSSWISETILNISHTPILYWTNCSTSANLNNRSQHSTSAHLNIFSTSQLLLCLLGCLIEDISSYGFSVAKSTIEMVVSFCHQSLLDET